MPALPLVLWLIALVCCVTVIVMVLKTDTQRSHTGHPADSASATSVASAAKTASDGVVASDDTVAAGRRRAQILVRSAKPSSYCISSR